MSLYWKSFKDILIRLLTKPIWMMLFISLALMGLVYMNQTIRDLPVAVIDLDHSTTSRDLIRQLNTSSKIEVIPYSDIPQAIADINNQKIFAAIVIPNHFEAFLMKNKDVTVLGYGDASNRLANGLIQQDILASYKAFLASFHNNTMRNSGFQDEQIDIILNPIRSQTVALFNPGANFAAITFPGLLVMLLQHSLMIASTRTNIALHSLPQGKPPKAVFLGSLSALVPIWLFLSIILFVLWPWVLGYRQLASIPVILMMTFPFLFAVIGLSKLLTECLRRVEMIYLTLSFLTTPVFYLSGTIWPLEAMPTWVWCISHLLPSTWAVNMIAGVNQMGLSLSSVGFNMLMLFLLGCFYIILGLFISGLRNGTLRQRFNFSSRSKIN
ncbi:ABC transporter permease [Utexia brackfieldae]|uniref:ABC transporter permease n=1 Tax=Utexia brackfieldae TaxID=3074108 RepID=UPI00370D8E12